MQEGDEEEKEAKMRWVAKRWRRWEAGRREGSEPARRQPRLKRWETRDEATCEEESKRTNGYKKAKEKEKVGWQREDNQA
ncbi:hypothetical protein COCNU_03G000650 [Cocos nucifera]|uniref:Uncharacterized protein n=1 Tax=Cocos nucifera TaxID=13894 RepID=A0A8K0I1R8_COCNU|nr:hypothetical protein COCNU_03G000650 [Cocos nucifera]